MFRALDRPSLETRRPRPAGRKALTARQRRSVHARDRFKVEVRLVAVPLVLCDINRRWSKGVVARLANAVEVCCPEHCYRAQKILPGVSESSYDCHSDFPLTNVVISKSKRDTLARKLNMIETLVAKFFAMLSAYLITKATVIPPSACRTTAVQTTELYPAKKPSFAICSPSLNITPMKSAGHRE